MSLDVVADAVTTFTVWFSLVLNTETYSNSGQFFHLPNLIPKTDHIDL